MGKVRLLEESRNFGVENPFESGAAHSTCCQAQMGAVFGTIGPKLGRIEPWWVDA